MASRTHAQDEYHPAGRLVPVFASTDMDGQIDLAMSLGRKAASFGETVLMLDCQAGAMMDKAAKLPKATSRSAFPADAAVKCSLDVIYVTSRKSAS